MHIVKEFEDLAFPVRIEQKANGKFRITYGRQIADGLDYSAAARAFGECVFHALACDGLLDNQK